MRQNNPGTYPKVAGPNSRDCDRAGPSGTESERQASERLRQRRDEELAARRAALERDFLLYSLGFWALFTGVLVTALVFSLSVLHVGLPTTGLAMLVVTIGSVAWYFMLSGATPLTVAAALAQVIKIWRRRG